MNAVELYRYAEGMSIPVMRFSLPENGSISLQRGDGSCVIGIDDMPTGAEEAVHLSHELGHCVTHSFYNEYALLDVRQKHEHRADRWAIENMISVDELDRAISEGYTEIWQLAEHFDVTESFMVKAVCLYTFGNLAVNEYFPA